MVHVRRERGVEPDPCPDAETVSAVLEGDVPPLLREHVHEHLRQCPVCSALRDQLSNFDVEAPLSEAAWQQTEKRLDNWVDALLRAQNAAAQRTKLNETPTRSQHWAGFWRFFSSRSVVWGMGVAVVLIFVVEAVFVAEYWRELVPPAQLASRPAAPPIGPSSGVPATRPVRNSQQHGETKPIPAGVERAAAPPEVGRHSGPLASARPEPPPPPAQAPTRSLPRSSALATASMRVPPPARSAAIAPAPSVRLEPEDHLLVAVSSARRLENGTLEFRGTLLLPIVHSGSVPLDKGAELVGTGTTSGGKTSLTVLGFSVQGDRYALHSGSGAVRGETPGKGGSVDLERSQVLEMWSLSPAVYEKTPRAEGQQNPDK